MIHFNTDSSKIFLHPKWQDRGTASLDRASVNI